ncbi:MAG: hypothetical protein WCS21_04780 [Lachnospiraceae bacterium]
MSFYFKGEKSDDMGVILDDEVFEAVPEMNVEDISIEGRDGGIYQELNYKDVEITKNAYLVDLENADAVKQWLSGSGVFAIGERWKMAHIYKGIEFKRFGPFKYSFSLQMILSPFWQRIEDWTDLGTISTDGTTAMFIQNIGNTISKPMIRITPQTSTNVDISINGTRFTLPSLGSGNTITINCEDKEEDNPKNISIGYTYPSLSPGKNKIEIHAGSAKLSIRYKDRWI